MKKLINIMAVVAIAVLITISVPIVNAAHTDSGCAGCHSMHNAPDTAFAATMNVPLWNEDLTLGSATVLRTTTLVGTDEAVGAVSAIGDTSALMCLSCHDGVTNSGMAAGYEIGQDLSDSHPIGMEFSDTGFGTLTTEFNLPSGITLGPAALPTLLELNTAGDSVVVCATCHDVHDGGSIHTGTAFILRGVNTSGELCKSCHKK